MAAPENESAKDADERQPAPKAIDAIRDSSFFLKQVDARGRQAQQASLDIEQQHIEVIHHGNDYSLDESRNRNQRMASSQHANMQIKSSSQSQSERQRSNRDGTLQSSQTNNGMMQNFFNDSLNTSSNF